MHGKRVNAGSVASALKLQWRLQTMTCILWLAWRPASPSKWESWSCGTAALQHHHPWCCLLGNRHWARFVTAGSSSQVPSCLALVSALSAQISSLRGEETMQEKAWLSHWTGCERPGSWLIPDVVWLRPALARKWRANFPSFLLFCAC